MTAPLVANEIIGTEFNFILAVFIGFAFGFILEQAGFGNAKKLAGQFYGYDFTVLRVFFTAAVTASIALVFLNYFGLIELHKIFINEFFVTASIVGGIVMGLGFIMGGFCPGTGIIGAVTGKIDGMIFVLGLLIGSLIFGESFNSIKETYTANYQGPALIFEDLGWSRNSFVFALSIVALSAFIITYLIEKKSKKERPWKTTHSAAYGWPTLLLIIISFIVLLLPERKSNNDEIAAKEVFHAFFEESALMKADEFAYHIMYENLKSYSIIDLRDKEAFEAFHFPNSVNIPLSEILHPFWVNYVKEDIDSKKIILCSNGGIHAVNAWVMYKRLGIPHQLYVLRKGYNALFLQIFFAEKNEMMSAKEVDRYRFMQEFKDFLSKPNQEKQTKIIQEIEVKDVPEANIKGGC